MPNNQHFPFHDLHFKLSDEQTYDEHDPVCGVNKDKINVDNHPIILARGRFGGYRGEYGAIGEMGRLGSELFGDLKEGEDQSASCCGCGKVEHTDCAPTDRFLLCSQTFRKKLICFQPPTFEPLIL